MEDLIPVAIPNLAGREREYLNRCVEENFVSTAGPFVSRFEELAAEALGAERAAAVASGTCGLHLALRVLGVGPGDLVLVPSLTFIASANAVSHCGAQPWLADSELSGWTMDATVLADLLRRETRRDRGGLVHAASGRRVAAVMPVYTLGSPADMDAIGAVAGEYGLAVLADGAAAIGARYKGRNLGDLADLTMVSFNGNKTVTAGGGGIVAGRGDLVERVRHLSSQAKTGPGYRHDAVGYNYRMTNLQAAVGCAQLERLEFYVGRKRAVRAVYAEAFTGVDGLELFPVPAWAESACWFSGVLTESADAAARLRACLSAKGVGSSPFWEPLHCQPPYVDAPRSAMTVVESLWDRAVVLPCSTSLSEADQARVIGAVLDCACRR